MKEINLSKTSIFVGNIPNILKEKFNFNNLKKNFILNKKVKNFQSKDLYDYHCNYLNIQDHKHLIWIDDYIRDHFKLVENVPRIRLFQKAGIVQNKNESLGFHYHFIEKDMENSPIFSFVYTINCGLEDSHIILKYPKDNRKDNFCKINLKQNNFIMFPSYFEFSITKNLNIDPLVNLVLQYKQAETS